MSLANLLPQRYQPVEKQWNDLAAGRHRIPFAFPPTVSNKELWVTLTRGGMNRTYATMLGLMSCFFGAVLLLMLLTPPSLIGFLVVGSYLAALGWAVFYYSTRRLIVHIGSRVSIGEERAFGFRRIILDTKELHQVRIEASTIRFHRLGMTQIVHGVRIVADPSHRITIAAFLEPEHRTEFVKRYLAGVRLSEAPEETLDSIPPTYLGPLLPRSLDEIIEASL